MRLRPPRPSRLRCALAVVVPGLLAGCGGSAAQGDAAPDLLVTRGSASSRANDEGMAATATVGGLDRRAVQRTFAQAFSEIRGCVDRGRQRLPYLGGEVGLAIRIGPTGQLVAAELSRSTLGDAETERCILRALRARRWPRPVGGQIGEASQSYGFEPPVTDPPRVASTEELREAMARSAEPGEQPFDELIAQLERCRQQAGAGSLAVTFYLDEDGMAQSSGVSGEGEAPARAAPCVATVIATTSFPGLGAPFVKVTVRLP